jgi:phosphoribosyl-dephospho-CoA transferase
MNWKRHTFVDVSDAGREAILAELVGSGTDSAALREKLGRVLLPERAGARVPGVIRREDGPSRLGCVPVGFSQPVPGPVPGRERRLRIAAFARLEDVVRVTSPYEIMSLPLPRRTASIEALVAVKARAQSVGLVLGVWGSVAMELYTGLPCTYDGSDLDLIVAGVSQERLSCFMVEVKAMEEHFALRIDVEVDLPNGYGVQLKELLGQGRKVLGKSITGVALLDRAQILAEFSHDPLFATCEGALRSTMTT